MKKSTFLLYTTIVSALLLCSGLYVQAQDIDPVTDNQNILSDLEVDIRNEWGTLYKDGQLVFASNLSAVEIIEANGNPLEYNAEIGFFLMRWV